MTPAIARIMCDPCAECGLRVEVRRSHCPPHWTYAAECHRGASMDARPGEELPDLVWRWNNVQRAKAQGGSK